MNVMVEIEKDEVVVTIEKDYKRFSDVSTSHGFVVGEFQVILCM